ETGLHAGASPAPPEKQAMRLVIKQQQRPTTVGVAVTRAERRTLIAKGFQEENKSGETTRCQDRRQSIPGSVQRGRDSLTRARGNPSAPPRPPAPRRRRWPR